MRLVGGSSDTSKQCMDVIVDCRAGPCSPPGPAWRMRSPSLNRDQPESHETDKDRECLADASDLRKSSDRHFENLFSKSKNCKSSVTKSKYGFAKAWSSLLQNRSKVVCTSQVAPGDALSSITSQEWTDENIYASEVSFGSKSPARKPNRKSWFGLRWRSSKHNVHKADEIVMNADDCVQLPFCLPRNGFGHSKSDDAFEKSNYFGACQDLCVEFEQPLGALFCSLPSCNPRLPGTII
eukprot:TRINITY_DN45216_c0_g1_i1.p1 TRINITY_DN45216_c0_g1~~TRINITY_DN45216_c0_g1_i1.p1  ORF type:complete len:238 (+),score=34.61 TRINITY_DN45216_c0_g1_i1:74-787(+)